MPEKSLQTGETDLIFIPPPDQIPQLLDQGFKISTGRPPHVWFMWTNQGNPINRDVRVQRAISMALDRQGLATDLLRDTAIPAYGMSAPGAPSHDPDFKMFDYDPAEAKKLLSAAGHDSFQQTWWFPTAGSGNILPVQMAQWMQANFAEIGFTMQIEAVEWTAFGAATVSRWSEGVSGSSSFGMSTDAFLGIQGNKKWYTPEAPGGGWIEHDKEAADQVASILDRAEVEFDREESTRLYIEAKRLMTDRQWYLTVVHDSAPVAMRQEVQGFVNAAQHSYDFKTVWLEDA